MDFPSKQYFQTPKNLTLTWIKQKSTWFQDYLNVNCHIQQRTNLLITETLFTLLVFFFFFRCCCWLIEVFMPKVSLISRRIKVFSASDCINTDPDWCINHYKSISMNNQGTFLHMCIGSNFSYWHIWYSMVYKRQYLLWRQSTTEHARDWEYFPWFIYALCWSLG